MNRKRNIIKLTAIYTVSAFISILIGYFLPIENPLLKAGIADLIATVIIFAFSVVLNNSSVYDPYWSVAPIFLTIYWVIITPYKELYFLRILAIVIIIFIWGIRLTYNFLRQWKGFRHEDWRYAAYRTSTGKWYWVISFIGIHFFPTIIVFCASVPVYFSIVRPAHYFGSLDILASLAALGAVLIEGSADNRLRRFILARTDIGKTLQSGLWKYTRHPNYFGDAAQWWAYYLVALSTPWGWATIFGPAFMSFLLMRVSGVTLLEKDLKDSKPQYGDYIRRTSAFFPRFPRRG